MGASLQDYEWIDQYAKQYGVPASLVASQMQAESSGQQSAVSSTGAIGLMQLEPGTAAGLGVDPYNPQQNIQGGVKYDAQLYKQYGNWTQALEAYNEGPRNLAAGKSQSDGAAAYAQNILSTYQAVSAGSAGSAGSSGETFIGNGLSFTLDKTTPGNGMPGTATKPLTVTVTKQFTAPGAGNGKGCTIGLDPSSWVGWLQCEAYNLIFILLGLVILIAVIISLIDEGNLPSIPMIPLE